MTEKIFVRRKFFIGLIKSEPSFYCSEKILPQILFPKIKDPMTYNRVYYHHGERLSLKTNVDLNVKFIIQDTYAAKSRKKYIKMKFAFNLILH